MKNKFWLLSVFVPTLAWACPKGSTGWEGTCAYDNIRPLESSTNIATVWVSAEKPPKTTTGEWQTDKIRIVTLSPLSTVDDEISAAKKWDAAHGEPPKGE